MPVAVEFDALYDYMDGKLDALLTALGDPSVGPIKRGMSLLLMHPANGAFVLQPDTWDKTMHFLDRIASADFELVQADLQFPLLYEPYHLLFPEVDSYATWRTHYRKLAEEIAAR